MPLVPKTQLAPIIAPAQPLGHYTGDI
jgi:hypothetical protein